MASNIVVQSVTGMSYVASASSFSLTKPTGLAVGDLMIATGVTSDDSTTTYSFNTPTGWTAIASKSHSSAAQRRQWIGSFWKIADSADVAASAFSFTATGTARVLGMSCYRISGAHPTTPIENSATGTTGVGTTFSGTATFTPTYTNSLFLMFSLVEQGTTISGYSISPNDITWTEGYDATTTNITSSGATGLRSAVTQLSTFSYTLALAGQSSGILVEVKPAVSDTVSADILSFVSTALAVTIAVGVTIFPSVLSLSSSILTPAISSVGEWTPSTRHSATLTASTKSATSSWTPLAKTSFYLFQTPQPFMFAQPFLYDGNPEWITATKTTL